MRVIRKLPCLREAADLMIGLVSSTRTVFSTAGLLLFVLYMFACVGLELIAKDDSLRDSWVSSPSFPQDFGAKDFNATDYAKNFGAKDFDAKFGSLCNIMMTLFQFATLDSMAGLYRPLIIKSPALSLYFFVLVIVVSLALANLITATIVTGALAKDEKMRRTDERRFLRRDKLRFEKMFRALDLHGDGFLDLDLFEAQWHSAESRKALEEFEFKSARELFEVLDIDGSGKLEKAEFLEGFLSLSRDKFSGIPVGIQRSFLQLRHKLREIEETIKEVKTSVGTFSL